MKINRIPLIAIFTLFQTFAIADPFEELNTPDQAVRDKLAAELRTHVPNVPKSKWIPHMKKISGGQTIKEILNILQELSPKQKIPFQPGGQFQSSGQLIQSEGDGASYMQVYRIDSEWALACFFDKGTDILTERELIELAAPIKVTPPANFTGHWVTYYTNGRIVEDYHMKDGRKVGKSVEYHANGIEKCVEHYNEFGLKNGERITYYPSGNVRMRELYKDDMPVGNLIADLKSPDPEVRAKAAAKLKETYPRIPETKWMPLLEKIAVGKSEMENKFLLRELYIEFSRSISDGTLRKLHFLLDEEWELVCHFENGADLLTSGELIRSVSEIVVVPPKQYTGHWVTYFTNGLIYEDFHMKDGHYVGEHVWYHNNGIKSSVNHYNEFGEADGDSILYYRSGRVKSRSQYKDGKEVGIRYFYDESGKVTSAIDNTK
jgi:antitoxin component YwqK of YwqJK toxin-antitoxin module